MKKIGRGWERGIFDIYQIANLHEQVKKIRKPRQKRLNYEEKVKGPLFSCTIVESYGDIEQLLFAKSFGPGKCLICSGLQHRYALLHLCTGVLCCESLYRVELSDFLGAVR